FGRNKFHTITSDPEIESIQGVVCYQCKSNASIFGCFNVDFTIEYNSNDDFSASKLSKKAEERIFIKQLVRSIVL
ncbi:hypothetical protein J6590_100431, partial [Homalodisca vitripennis]